MNSRHRERPGRSFLTRLWGKLTGSDRRSQDVDFDVDSVDTSTDNLVPARFAELIEEHSALDIRLYEHAVELFRRRLAESFPDLLARYEGEREAAATPVHS